MEAKKKLRILADAAKCDASCANRGSKRARAEELGVIVTRQFLVRLWLR